MHSGLLFTCRALEKLQADRASELRTCFQRSYDEVLRHQHGWLVQSAVTVRVTAVCAFDGSLFFLFPSSAGDQNGTVEIRVLQTDIAGGIGGEAGRRTWEMAGGAEPDRRTHEALPGRRGTRDGIESGATRRLSSCCAGVDHGYEKAARRRNDDACSVCWRKQPSTLNIPKPGIDFGFALDRCHGQPTFVFSSPTHLANQKLEYL